MKTILRKTSASQIQKRVAQIQKFRNWPGAHFPTRLLLLLGIWVSVMGMMAESEIGLKRVVKLRQKKDTSHFQDFQKFND